MCIEQEGQKLMVLPGVDDLATCASTPSMQPDRLTLSHYPITYFDLANNETKPMPWFKVTREEHETTIHGSTGPFGVRFRKLL